MREKIFVAALFLFCSCRKEIPSYINKESIVALGHGGMGIKNSAPINSYESIMECLDAGADGAEMDVQMTKDSVLIAYHDKELSASTNMEGLVNSHSYEELKEALYTKPLFKTYNVITLDELFTGIKNVENFTFTFDCKLYAENYSDQYIVAYADALIRMIEKHNLQTSVLVESQEIEFLRTLKFKRPAYALFIYHDDFEYALAQAKENMLDGITMSTRNITKEQVLKAHENNFTVALWNVHNKKDNIDAIIKQPDFIQTDNIKHLVKVLK